jgi:Fe2+ or Zn2+ uptake regulation protein
MSHIDRDYAQRIRKKGYRLTPQRQIIMDALCEFGGHATVQELAERVRAQSPVIDLATVYRTLRFFCDLRLVTAAQIGGDVVYEIAGEEPHHHLICRVCGAQQILNDHHLQSLVEHLLQEHGFWAEIDHLAINGMCQACYNKTAHEPV